MSQRVSFLQLVLPFAFGLLALQTQPASAGMVQVDEIIFQDAVGLNSANLTGSVDLTLSGTTLTIVLANTSAMTGVSGAPNVLAGLGLQLNGLTIVNQGTVANPVYGSAIANLADIVGEPPADSTFNDVSFEWGYGDASSGHFATEASLAYHLALGVITADMDASLDASQHDFKPPGKDGVDFGLINTNVAGPGGSTLIQGPVTITIQLAGSASAFTALQNGITAGDLDGNVGLLFGSPTSGPGTNEVPEPASVVLFGFGIFGLAGRRVLRRKVA